MEIVKKQITLHHTVSVIGGFMGGYTIFNHSDVFANAQTGNLIRLVLSACSGDFGSIGFLALSFAVYAAGNAFYAVARRYSRLSMKIVSLIITSLSVPPVSVLCLSGNPILSILPLCFAMPVQWNAYKSAAGNSSATTFSSNNVRQAVIQLTNYLMDRDRKSARNARFYWMTLLCFHIGVAASCLLSLFFSVQSIWFAYFFIAAAAVAYYRYESEKIRAFPDRK
ncbi:MAG: YoaK family protein [Ruminococcus sp.]